MKNNWFAFVKSKYQGSPITSNGQNKRGGGIMATITIVSYGSFTTPQDTLERKEGIWAEIALRVHADKNNASKCYIIRQSLPTIDIAEQFCKEQIDLMHEMGHTIRFREPVADIKVIFPDPTITDSFLTIPTTTKRQ